jgi:diguanylate cyclase (GGDEF)-like protein
VGMRNRVPHLSLLTQFSILSLLCVVALGAALVLVLRDQIHDRAATNARVTAQSIAGDIADQHVTGRDLERGLDKEKLNAIDRRIETLVLRGRIQTAKIYDPQGRIVYSFDRREIGQRDLTKEVRLALKGHTQSAFEGVHDAPPTMGRVYEVYVPLHLIGDREPAGVFEVYMPYAPIAAQINKDSRRLYPVLIAGLALLYLVLFPIVARASRKLRRHAETSHHQALHDDLTGVANRRQLLRRLEHEIESASAVDRSFALLMLDLDRFKEVNDALGHGHGDRLLRDVAARLATTVRHGDLLARLGGDEFALLLADVSGAPGAIEVAGRVKEVLHDEFVLGGVPLLVEASVGIAIFPEHGRDAETLLQAADIAMYAAKRSGTHFELYMPDRDRRGPDRVTRLGELRRALAEEELVLFYQPKVDLRRGEVSGAEALIRWQHPELGLIPPMEFLPLAEQTGLIGPLTSYVISAALKQAREWALEGIEVPVAVNVSERSLLDPRFPVEVESLLERWGVPGQQLQLELTERGLIADVVTAMDVIERLCALGVRISIDDFGTGYSSLGRLVELPIQELKIDRTFVMDMDGDGPGAAIVRSTIDLGHHLGLEVVAEGVETEEQLRELRTLGCDGAQGFHLLRPLPADEVAAWLRDRAQALSGRPAEPV